MGGVGEEFGRQVVLVGGGGEGADLASRRPGPGRQDGGVEAVGGFGEGDARIRHRAGAAADAVAVGHHRGQHRRGVVRGREGRGDGGHRAPRGVGVGKT